MEHLSNDRFETSKRWKSLYIRVNTAVSFYFCLAFSSNGNLLKCLLIKRDLRVRKLFFVSILGKFFWTFSIFSNRLGAIVSHVKIPSLQCLSSVLSAFAIGIIDNPLGIARTVAKNACGICVFPLESFRFKRLRSPPSGNRSMFHRCADSMKYPFYREASLPTICYAVYWMSLYWIEKK